MGQKHKGLCMVNFSKASPGDLYSIRGLVQTLYCSHIQSDLYVAAERRDDPGGLYQDPWHRPVVYLFQPLFRTGCPVLHCDRNYQ